MANEAAVAEEGGSPTDLEEVDGGKAGRPDAKNSKLSRFMKVQLYLPLRDVISLEEIRLKFMRQGTDVTRSGLIGEAIKLLAHAVSEGKLELRG